MLHFEKFIVVTAQEVLHCIKIWKCYKFKDNFKKYFCKVAKLILSITLYHVTFLLHSYKICTF